MVTEFHYQSIQQKDNFKKILKIICLVMHWSWGALIFRGYLVIDWYLRGHQVIVFPYEKMPYLHNFTFLCVIINLQRNGLFLWNEIGSADNLCSPRTIRNKFQSDWPRRQVSQQRGNEDLQWDWFCIHVYCSNRSLRVHSFRYCHHLSIWWDLLFES